ncbi:S-layer homology domain-containing protein [Phascolarctobacterium succinatutens]|uniref:S-layer homology domain-containing protein n=1 Tax=Phascolarctobacterium succinatutens TaxID=626940 RepID=UPI003AB2AB4C
MKKSLVLAMAMALGVTASAYAANPFSDVPAGHWAYDSINKLAAAGVIEGYGDSTFGGDKLMTRYEMAQIVAKAMAKGANVDKLAAEFADELDNLGVRVANLEKKADNVKITGNIRYNYADYDEDGYATGLRSRIWVKGQINDDWSYTGMLQNVQNLKDNAGNEDTKFQRAYVDGKIGGLAVEAGRLPLYLVDGNLYDTRADGIVASYGKDVKVTGFYAKPTDQGKALNSAKLDPTYDLKESVEFDNVYGAKVDAKFGVVAATAGYTVFQDGTLTIESKFMGVDQKDVEELDDNKIWNAGVAFDLAKDLNLSANYMKSSEKYLTNDDDAIVVGLSYAGAKAAKEGSFGVYGKYYDQARSTVVAHTMNGAYGNHGFKGYMVGANYTFAKNIVGAVEYYDLEDKLDDSDMKTLWSQVVFTF